MVDIPSENPDIGKATTGVRFDQGKPRVDLLPPELMLGVGEVLAFGAKKYADRNWEKGMKWGRVIASLLRHTFSFMLGEKYDKESGLPHTWHIATNAAFLVAYEARGIGEDDRNHVIVTGTTAKAV